MFPSPGYQAVSLENVPQGDGLRQTETSLLPFAAQGFCIAQLDLETPFRWVRLMA
jgi:hypothetical protein